MTLDLNEARAILAETVSVLHDFRGYYVYDNKLGGKEADNPELARADRVLERARQFFAALQQRDDELRELLR